MFDPDGFNPPAERAIFWTRDQLEDCRRVAPGARTSLGVPRRATAQLPRKRLPVRPRLGPQSAQRIRLPRRHLQSAQDGTHFRAGRDAIVSRAIPTSRASSSSRLPDDLYQFSSPEEIDYCHQLDGRKTLCNVGSVGQPRDGDPRACYVLLDGDTIRYRRVEYDYRDDRSRRSTPSPSWRISSATAFAMDGDVEDEHIAAGWPRNRNRPRPAGGYVRTPRDAIMQQKEFLLFIVLTVLSSSAGRPSPGTCCLFPRSRAIPGRGRSETRPPSVCTRRPT